MKKKGLIAYIYENGIGQNCSNGGLSSKCKQVIVTGPYIPEIFEESEDCPAVEVTTTVRGYIKALPCKGLEGQCGPMFGGTFIWSSDSRFSELVSAQPVPLHDRFETWEQYESMSR